MSQKNLFIYFEIQSTLNYVRHCLIQIGFHIVSTVYKPFHLRSSWKLRSSDLLDHSTDSLGFHIGCFLLKHDLELQDHAETHDAFHVLTGYNTSSLEEIGMQFWLHGNGKRSFPLYSAMAAGLLLYPDKFRYLMDCQYLGQRSRPIHHLNYLELLQEPMDSLRIQNQIFTHKLLNLNYEN
ncbi:hypothetical protein [Nonlabens spongiae]|nr:hypothetical protein [Nonlabens spongiae]